MEVLLVDDDESFLKLCSKRLESQSDFNVKTVSNPEKVIDIMKEQDIDCLVCDYDMPEIKGTVLCKKVKKKFPEVCFILQTSYSDCEIVENAFEAGADEYLNKGIGSCQYQVLSNRIRSLTASEKKINLEEEDLHEETDSSVNSQKEKFLEEIVEASQKMSEARTKEGIAEIAVKTMENGLKLPYTGLFLLNRAKDNFEPIALSESAKEIFDEVPKIQKNNSLAGEVFKKKECVFFEDLDEADTYNPETKIKSEIIVPMEEGIIMSGSLSKKAFSNSERYAAEILGSVTEASIRRAEREELLMKREQEMADQNERLNQFASILSHDLRSPLNLAQGYLELGIDTKNKEDLKEVQKAHKRIETIINSVLKLSKHTEEVNTEQVDMKKVAENSWKFANPGVGDKLKIMDSFSLETDPEKMKQILENLFSNSIEHSDINVAVKIGSLDEGFYVEDDGPGIPEKDRKKVLEFGYSEGEGTGFGLSIIKQVSNLLGFQMEVEESREGGARFEFERKKSV